MAFYDRWPSWVTELLGGAALALLCAAVIRNVIAAGIVALVFSAVYESSFDRNGWSWSDFGQRAVGIAIGLVLGWWVY